MSETCIKLKGLFASADARYGFVELVEGVDLTLLDSMSFNIKEFKKTLKSKKTESVTFIFGKLLDGCHDYMYVNGEKGYPIGVDNLINCLNVLEAMGFDTGYLWFISHDEPYFMTANYPLNNNSNTEKQIVIGIAQYYGKERSYNVKC